MTHIVDPLVKTKKQLKELAAQGMLGRVFLHDPSIINPDSGGATCLVDRHGSVFVTNHPKRSWFAEITKDRNGNYIVK